MKSKKEEKYIVFKKDDVEGFFSQFTHGLFTTKEEKKHIDKVTWKEVVDAVNNKNKYIVCNQDEPYADLVWQIILMGEDAKQVS